MAKRRALFLLASLASGVLALALLAAFVWPEASLVQHPDYVDLGTVEQFEPGTVTMLSGVVEHGTERWPLRQAVSPHHTTEVHLAVARYPDGSVMVFLARDPNSGCTIPWRPTFEFDGMVGWFRDPCHGSTFTMRGERVFGPAPRDLDRFASSVDERGHLVVDVRALLPGGRS